MKQESKSIINQLLGFGVTPDYLINYGISEEIIGICFQELDYRLPPHLMHLLPTTTTTSNYHNRIRGTNNHNQSHSRSNSQSQSVPLPFLPPPPPPPPSLTPQEILEQTKARLELEISKREELLARKAAASSLANKRAAEKAVSFLDDLFSSRDTTLPTITTRTADTSSLDQLPIVTILSPTATTFLPLPPTQIDQETAATTTSLSRSTTTAVTSNRPTAIDFETLPPPPPLPIPSTSTTTKTIRSGFLQPDPNNLSNSLIGRQSLIIDLSDDDSDEEDDEEDESALEGEKVAVEVEKISLPSPNIASRKPSPSLPPLPTTTTLTTPNTFPSNPIITTTSVTPMMTALEAKELEIQRIRMKIAKMEKKRSTSSSGLITPTTGGGGGERSRGSSTSRESSTLPE